MNKQNIQPAERDISKTIHFLTRMFEKVSAHLDAPKWTKETGANPKYKAQTEFAYILNEITAGAPSMRQTYIAAANDLIDKLLQQKEQTKK